MKQPLHIIVAGASAGGFQALSALFAAIQHLPDTAVFVVQHMAKNSSPVVLRNILQKSSFSFVCITAANCLAIEAGHIYIAPPEHHLIVKRDYMRLIDGPPVNYWRPSIDVLFRSAAVAYSSQVVGVVLSGLLDDGTAGMVAIKRCGGTCIVQEPDEAEFHDMPSSVLQKVDVDFRVPVADMGYILDDLFSKPDAVPAAVPEDIVIETQITENMGSHITELETMGTRSNYTCPECGKSLWSVSNDPVKRYRCIAGHSFTEGLLLDEQAGQVKESLWTSIRMMEERRDLLLNNTRSYQAIGNAVMSQKKQQEAITIDRHISQLKKLIHSLKETGHQ